MEQQINHFLAQVVGNMWYFLIFLSALDIFTGILASGIRRKLDSGLYLTGFLKKLMMFAVLLVSVVIDLYLGAGGLITKFTYTGLVGWEVLSITENVRAAGFNINFIHKFLNDKNEKFSDLEPITEPKPEEEEQQP